MALGSPHSDEVRCDFPFCTEPFEQGDDKRVALAKEGGVLAFCELHSARLITAGIPLRPLVEAQGELDGVMSITLHRKGVERLFILSLK